MFTGIIQTKATISSIERKSSEARLVIKPFCMYENVQLGESIAVNGVCLTVESFDAHTFSAYASSKTLELSNLGKLSLGSIVNLERALSLGDRLGGHIVSGHVDCVAKVVNIEKQLSSAIYSIELLPEYKGLIIPQGSVCLDGISLTVTEVNESSFSVNIIPETQKETTVSEWKIGKEINLETDIIGKYVHSRALAYTNQNQPQSKLTESYLRELGF